MPRQRITRRLPVRTRLKWSLQTAKKFVLDGAPIRATLTGPYSAELTRQLRLVARLNEERASALRRKFGTITPGQSVVEAKYQRALATARRIIANQALDPNPLVHLNWLHALENHRFFMVNKHGLLQFTRLPVGRRARVTSKDVLGLVDAVRSRRVHGRSSL